MTDMTVVPDVPDTPPDDTPSSIHPVETVSARRLARETAAILRAVADDGHSFAIGHFGRVIGFLVPREGREPVRRRGNTVYEVPEPEPLLELTDVQTEILKIMHRDGHTAPDRLIPDGAHVGEALIALSELECTQPPLIRKTWGGYKLLPAGVRHAEELGL